MNTVVPPLLQRGDVVAIVATARYVTKEQTAPFIHVLEQEWGLKVKLPAHLYDRREVGGKVTSQFGCDDELRAEMLQQQLDDPEVKAIFCARGGYGTVRIVDRIDWSRFRQQPKWIVGYSDVTVLHSHIQRNLGIATLHATMPINVAVRWGGDHRHIDFSDYFSLQSLYYSLFVGRFAYDLGTCVPEGSADPSISLSDHVHTVYSPKGAKKRRREVGQPYSAYNREGDVTAPVVGGNLSVLCSLMGSASEPDTDGKVLMIEDLDEYEYHLDRMLMCLRRAGKFDNLAALMVGQFTDIHDNDVPFGSLKWDMIYNIFSGYDYPAIFFCPFGHIGMDNGALPLGVEARLSIRNVEATTSARLSFDYSEGQESSELLLRRKRLMW